MRRTFFTAAGSGLLSLASCSGNIQTASQPNIIYILADDLGYGDLGCYGQKLIKTPNLDRMAGQGLRFTQHYSGSTVCAPSRSVLMTGMHTGHTYVRGNKSTPPEGQIPIAGEVYTLAEMLHDAGYKTGAFGKWGLGMNNNEGSPVKQGFDRFFGYLCQGQAHRYYPVYLWDNNVQYPLEGNDWTSQVTFAPDVIQKETLKFIRENHKSPFFVYVPSVIPHAEIIAPDDTFLAMYKGKFPDSGSGNNPEMPYEGNDYGSEKFRIEGYASQPRPRETFAAMVSRLDHQVGEILNLLDELGIADNTLIMFASDNGPHREGGADPDFFNSNGGLRGYKRDLYEGGIRSPMIVRWPAKIKKAAVTNHVSAFWDVMPTLAEITGAKIPHPIDGISFAPLLTGKGKQKKHDYLYWEFHEQGGKLAIRKGNWKAVRYNVFKEGAKTELYYLTSDPGEINNIADQHPEKTRELENHMKTSRSESQLFEFPAIWNE